MRLEEACAEIQASFREVYGSLKEIDGQAAEDVFKLASAMVITTSVFHNEDLAFLNPKIVYDRAVERGHGLEVVRRQYLEVLMKILDSIDSIHGIQGGAPSQDVVVAAVRRRDGMGVARQIENAVKTKRLVIHPIREIVARRRMEPGGAPGRPPAPGEERRLPIPVLKKGHSYLILGERPDRAFEVFAEYVKNGSHGLCLSRYYPKKTREKYNLEKTPMLWLSHTESDENHLDPSNLGIIINILRDFFDKTENGIVLLEGIEYLIIQNGFETVLRFVQYVNEHVVIRQVILLLPLNESSLEGKEAALLKAELEPIP